MINKQIESILVEDKFEPRIENKNNYFDASDYIKYNINNIFSNDDIEKEKILCVGQVQSGKTKNIISCISKAMIDNYDAIIIFAGNNNLLLNQTHERIKYDIEINSIAKEKRYEILFTDQHDNIGNRIRNNKKFILCILKGDNQLTNMCNSIRSNAISDKKFLIVDDESDYGTFNSGKKYDPSKFYYLLEETYNHLKNAKLIYFTATPFANLLTQKGNNDFSKIVVLKNNEEYCGINEFDKNFDKTYLKISNDKNNLKESDEIFYKSIYIYLLYASKLIIDKQENFSDQIKTQFLINISSETNAHSDILCSITKIINFLSEKTDYELEKYFHQTIVFFDFYNDFSDFLERKSIYIKTAREIINYIKSNESYYELNGKNNENKNVFINRKFQHEIIVGGVMLSRGVTFENLITQLLLNYPEEICIDTILQRCRWFGYRKDKQKYMKIIVTEKLKQALISAKKYVNIFTPGILDFYQTKKAIIDLDNSIDQNANKIRSTSNDKTK